MHSCTRLLTLVALLIWAHTAWAQRTTQRDLLTTSTVFPIRTTGDVTAPIPPAISGFENDRMPVHGRPPGRNGRSLLSLGSGDSVGYTRYDFQTNASMPDRIINWPAPTGENGFLSTMIAMASTTPAPSYDDRGTYGAVAIASGPGLEWLPITIDSWRRIESERTGFCDIDHLADGRVVFVSHAGNRVVLNRERRPGTGDFELLEIPGADRGLWARIAVGENDVLHVIWTYQNTEPEFHTLKYARSTNAGTSWETPLDATGPGSMVGINLRGVQGGDGYAIAANGPNVVIWYYSQSVQIIQIRSRDNGTLWSADDAIVVFQAAYQRIYTTHENADSIYWTDPEISPDSAVGFRSDTAFAPGSSFDLLVESDGRVRGVYAIFPTYLTRYYLNGDDTTASTFLSGIIYQGEENDPDLGLIYFTELDLQASRSIVPLPPGLSNPTMFHQPRAYTHGFGRWPNLGRDQEGNLYVVYTSGANGDVVTGTPTGGTSEQTYYRGHTYITWTPDGATWADPQNLSPNGVDAQFATLADDVDEELHITYQADTYPGDFLTSSGTGGSLLHPEDVNNHEILIFPTENLNTIGVDGAAAYTGASITVHPNPSSDRTEIAVTLRDADVVRIDLFDAIGRSVATLATEARMDNGRHQIVFDAGNLPIGTYYVRLAGQKGTITTPFSVVR